MEEERYFYRWLEERCLKALTLVGQVALSSGAGFYCEEMINYGALIVSGFCWCQ